jgi:hypothetical protein
MAGQLLTASLRETIIETAHILLQHIVRFFWSLGIDVLNDFFSAACHTHICGSQNQQLCRNEQLRFICEALMAPFVRLALFVRLPLRACLVASCSQVAKHKQVSYQALF